MERWIIYKNGWIAPYHKARLSHDDIDHIAYGKFVNGKFVEVKPEEVKIDLKGKKSKKDNG